MATATTPYAEQAASYDIGWDGHQSMVKLGKAWTAYDRGSMGLMAPYRSHERFRILIGRMIDTVTEVLDSPMVAAGSTEPCESGGR